ncbi:MAG: Chromosomal replication initiator, DnaA C-terminal domain, partial [Candidatus Sulfotelmatobacter sp.]|nr:Chromosomal replication initiator, DnaA C-terminal domain [Candidatus Sulfotelmatobacter sp.]
RNGYNGHWIMGGQSRRRPAGGREMMRTSERRTGIWRLSLEQIEATVADHLGNGRVPGNQAAPCLSRQVSMYLAKNVVGWSTTRIGRFYNGRHHTTVLHAIEKIEHLRQTDEPLDALIEVITAELTLGTEGCLTERFQARWSTALVDAVADRVLKEIRRLTSEGKVEGPLALAQREGRVQ